MANGMRIVSDILNALQLNPKGHAMKRISRVANGRVCTGPFAGMRYDTRAHCSSGLAKLVGCYELELAHIVEEFANRSPAVVVDVGAAEGYYAVGLALRLPEARVVAYESDAGARDLLCSLAAANSVGGRIDMRGECDAEGLRACIEESRGEGLLIIDAEGAEFELLGGNIVSRLRDWLVLVEIHPWAGEKKRLCDAFTPTHFVTDIPAVERGRQDVPEVLQSPLWNWVTARCLSEFRPPGMSWLVCTPLEGDRNA